MTRTVRDMAVGESAVLGAADLPEPTGRRLVEMGLRPGERVTLLQRAVGGARVVSIHGSRVALDARTAGRLALAEDGGAA